MKLTVFSSDGTTSSEKDFANIPTFEGDKGLQAVKEVIVAINANNRDAPTRQLPILKCSHPQVFS